MRRSTVGYDSDSSSVASLASSTSAVSLAPNGLRVSPAAEATIDASDDVLAPDHPGEVEDAVGDDLRVLDDVGGVADDPATSTFPIDVSLDFPLVFVTDVAGLDRMPTNAKQDVDDVPERQ
jgi:hypothetical protein